MGNEDNDDQLPESPSHLVAVEQALVENQVYGLLRVVRQLEGTNRSKWEPAAAEEVLKQVLIVFPFERGKGADGLKHKKWLQVYQNVLHPISCTNQAMQRRVERAINLYQNIEGLEELGPGVEKLVPDAWTGSIRYLRELFLKLKEGSLLEPRKREHQRSEGSVKSSPETAEYRGALRNRRERETGSTTEGDFKGTSSVAPARGSRKRSRPNTEERADVVEPTAEEHAIYLELVRTIVEPCKAELMMSFEAALNDLFDKYIRNLEGTLLELYSKQSNS